MYHDYNAHILVNVEGVCWEVVGLNNFPRPFFILIPIPEIKRESSSNFKFTWQAYILCFVMGPFPQSALLLLLLSSLLFLLNISFIQFATSIPWQAFLSFLNSMRSAGLEIWKAQVCYSEKSQRGGSLTFFRWFAVLLQWYFPYARSRSWSFRFGYKYKEKTMIAYVITSLYCKIPG